jgi:hypothetical protein
MFMCIRTGFFRRYFESGLLNPMMSHALSKRRERLLFLCPLLLFSLRSRVMQAVEKLCIFFVHCLWRSCSSLVINFDVGASETESLPNISFVVASYSDFFFSSCSASCSNKGLFCAAMAACLANRTSSESFLTSFSKPIPSVEDKTAVDTKCRAILEQQRIEV